MADESKFLEHLSRIAPVTLRAEPQCKAYAWFRSAEDNDAVPHHWLRGLEVYDTIEANTITHRSSVPYNVFRAAVADESLLDRPSDLRFWRPTGIGFLNRPGIVNIMEHGPDAGLQYAVFHELSPKVAMKVPVLSKMEGLAQLARDATLRSFWVLDRGDNDEDENLLIFSNFDSRSDAETFDNGVKSIWHALESMCELTRRTTWVECGVGFIGRS